MGLDITAYRRITPLDIPEGADAYEHGGFRAYPSRDFPGRADELQREAAYLPSDSMAFRAGSYSGYNDWREQLARLAGYPAVAGDDARHQHSRGAWAADGGPFWEMIHFSDCEGTIGAKVSAKLASDFAAYQAKVDALPDDPDTAWFKRQYGLWRQAFEMASDAGAVDFH